MLRSGGGLVSDHFRAILGCLLSETWTTPTLVELVSTPDGHVLGRCDGEAASRVFLGNSEDLLRNIHGVAIVAELDGDEIGYQLGRVAKIRRAFGHLSPQNVSFTAKRRGRFTRHSCGANVT